jgi:hypothetical protein
MCHSQSMANPKPIDRTAILDLAAVQPAVLGRTYKDKISGLVGLATSRTKFLYACVRVAIQPTTLKDDGGPNDAFFIDEQLLEEVTGKAAKVTIPYEEEPDAVELGKTYKDSITDFEGVAISMTKFLSSSQRVALQPSKLHEGKPIDAQYFDAHQLNAVKAKVTPKAKEAAAPGGPGNCAKPPACAKR